MKKSLYELTLSEAEHLIKCKDDNGEYLCRQGCLFHYVDNKGCSCCNKNAFLGNLRLYGEKHNLLSYNYKTGK